MNSRIFTAIVVAFSLAATAFSAPQTKQSPDSNPSRQQKHSQHEHQWKAGFERMAEQLKLSKTQIKELKEIMSSGRKEAHALFENKKLDLKERRSKMIAIRKHTHEQIFKIFTAEQKKKFEAMMKEWHKEWEHRHHSHDKH